MEAVKVSTLLNPRTSLGKCDLCCFMTDVKAFRSPVFPGWCVWCIGEIGELNVCEDIEHCHYENWEGLLVVAKCS